ncbi:hypothetical protein C4D60_Mb05t00910 [Musa balbisiana]|uniref:WAT1-related protein n=1 Tax=Musa balbisiana TaxID=52838 RepID=A0A4V4H7U8_MUSBA|nr:hypothetical protein C4D60_Mb05t00910 [Musa balbisiana]
MEGVKPVAGMVLVQVVFAGVNIFYKLALNDGMDSRILVAYRYLFAAAFLCPLAFFMERQVLMVRVGRDLVLKTRPKMTWKVLMLSFFSGLLGGTISQNLYLSCVRITSATFASAMTNLIPAITFILAVLFRMESLAVLTVSGQAKALGTLTGVGGAMLLTFYKGATINLWSTHIDLLRARHDEGGAQPQPQRDSGNHVMGSLFAVISCLSYAMWLIIQTRMSKEYPCHYTGTALLCFMAAAQSVVYALCGERSPLFSSIFNPLLLIIVALLSTFLLNEQLHLGSVIGSALIVAGLYAVLWGKSREAAKVEESPPELIDVFVVDASNTTGYQEKKPSTQIGNAET